MSESNMQGPGLHKITRNLMITLTLVANSALGQVDPVLVFLGGFASCPTLLRPQSPAPAEFWQLRDEASQVLGTLPGPAVVSCFGSDGQLRPETTPRSETIPPAASLLEHVSLVLASQLRPALILIGHSWGGSLAAHAVPEIRQYLRARAGDPRFAHVQNVPMLLVTIDPIDFNFCTPPAFNVLRNNECMKTPTSFAPSNPLYARVTQNVRGWLNVFQSEGVLLHSGPVGQFGPWGRVAVDWHLGGYRIAPHQEITRDARTWNAVRDWVLRFVGEG